MPGYIDTTDPARLGRLTGGIFYDFIIGELGLEERVHITGRLSDAELTVQYSLADVFLLPSRSDGSSSILNLPTSYIGVGHGAKYLHEILQAEFFRQAGVSTEIPDYSELESAIRVFIKEHPHSAYPPGSIASFSLRG